MSALVWMRSQVCCHWLRCVCRVWTLWCETHCAQRITYEVVLVTAFNTCLWMQVSGTRSVYSTFGYTPSSLPCVLLTHRRGPKWVNVSHERPWHQSVVNTFSLRQIQRQWAQCFIQSQLVTELLLKELCDHHFASCHWAFQDVFLLVVGFVTGNPGYSSAVTDGEEEERVTPLGWYVEVTIWPHVYSYPSSW